jgi:tetratricopeptide (TPR) repeat protein
MRVAPLLAACIVLTTTAVTAYEPGDVVVVVRPTEVRVADRVVGKIDTGNTLVVGRQSTNGLWVNFRVAGWIDPDDVVALKDATGLFDRLAQEQREKAEVFYGRGRVQQALERWDQAIADYTEAIRLAPEIAAHYEARGYARSRKRDFDGAVEDYNKAIELDPLSVQTYRLRAGLHADRGEYADAIADYNRAVRLNPNDQALINDRAWMLATCPDATYRNGEQAVADATRACELGQWDVFNRLGTLAASYAEKGDFESAVKWQRECLKLSPQRYRQAQMSRLRLYEAGKPYREVAGTWK